MPHTPGPWKVTDDGDLRIEARTLKTRATQGADTRVIVTTMAPNHVPTTAETYSNARLIAQAPAMLARIARDAKLFDQLADILRRVNKPELAEQAAAYAMDARALLRAIDPRLRCITRAGEPSAAWLGSRPILQRQPLMQKALSATDVADRPGQ